MKSRKNSSKNGSPRNGNGEPRRSITWSLEMFTTAGLARSTAMTTALRRIGSVSGAAPCTGPGRATAAASAIRRRRVGSGRGIVTIGVSEAPIVPG
jgi:hypothetical protein